MNNPMNNTEPLSLDTGEKIRVRELEDQDGPFYIATVVVKGLSPEDDHHATGHNATAAVQELKDFITRRRKQQAATSPGPAQRSLPGPGRGTGHTSHQMLEAPVGAHFIWCNQATWYPKALARHLGREDLHRLCGDRRVHAAVLDHAADRDTWSRDAQSNYFRLQEGLKHRTVQLSGSLEVAPPPSSLEPGR